MNAGVKRGRRGTRPKRSKQSLPGIAWPRLRSLESQGVRQLLGVFAQTEKWTPKQLAAAQFRQLHSLLRHARETVPFYRQHLAGCDLDASDLTPEHWRQVPLLTRRVLQAQGDALLSENPPPEHGRTGKVTTSGSTGMPVTVHRTQLCQTMWLALTARDHLWHDRDVGRKLASIRVSEIPQAHSPQGLHANGWGTASRFIGQPGPAALIDIGRPVDQQIEWLQREDPDYILTYASNLRALLHAAQQRGVRLASLRHAMTIAEALPADLRDSCRAVWGVEIKDIYSNQEHGPIALQCPDFDHYHLQSEAALVEILNDDNRPCEPGEIGRVVLTPLHNFAMPLIRYDLGDYAEVGAACPCGRGLPVLTRILGRVRNCLRAPSGEMFWPKVGEFFLREIAPIVQFQVVQRSLQRLEVTFVAERPLTPDEETEMRRRMVERIGHPFDIDLRLADAIPRGPGQKFEDVICAVED